MIETTQLIEFIGIALIIAVIVLLAVLMIRLPRVFDGAAGGLRDELKSGRTEGLQSARQFREEVAGTMSGANQTLLKTLETMSGLQQTQLNNMTVQLRSLAESNEAALDRIRNSFHERVRELQESNEKKLDEMRKTVDEKLHETLEKRLGESFQLVSERLEAVHNGLGEMKSLATGVGDLKKVLTNVKIRGTWAEIQLGSILEQMLTAKQYGKNVHVNPSSAAVVEFAVRLPGPDGDSESQVWLPIDSKFPQEDYLRLQTAAEESDPEAVRKATEALTKTLRAEAKDISEKYIDPPNTTDFAIMFLGTEGLYAEALRIPNLTESLQREFRVVVAGPTTIAAILNSLRMGFQSIAIERRASEVWRVLGAVKSEFGKFGEVLDRVKRNLQTAQTTIEQTGIRSRAIERKLRNVEELPDNVSDEILELESTVITQDLQLSDGTDS